jgi:uncharacterized protein (TIGR02284 family)
MAIERGRARISSRFARGSRSGWETTYTEEANCLIAIPIDRGDPMYSLKGHHMADNISSILNELVETSKDGEKGFRTAAEDTKNAELKAIFLRRADDCAKGADDLQELVSRLGGRPEEGGSVAGAMHRGWVNLKAAVSSRDDLAILEECERGEDVAKAKYRDALEDSTLPDDIRMVVQRQYDGVMRNHDQIRDLRDRYRSKRS